MKDSVKMCVGIAVSTALIIANTALVLAADMPMWLFWTILAVSVVPILIPLTTFDGTRAYISDGRLFVKAPFVDLDIPVSSIQAVELRTDFDAGLRIYGYGGIRRGSGDFTNGEFGSYVYAGDSRSPYTIVIRYDWKKIAAFNTADPNTTLALHSELTELTGKGEGVVTSVLNPADTARRHRRLKMTMYGVVAVCIATVVAIVLIMMVSGHVNVDMDDNRVSIDAPMMHEDILFSDISYVELRDDVDYGIRTGGYGGLDISSGKFRNDEFGDYRLAVHNDVGACVVLHLNDGDVVVFNLENTDATERFYYDLTESMGNPGTVEGECVAIPPAPVVQTTHCL